MVSILLHLLEQEVFIVVSFQHTVLLIYIFVTFIARLSFLSANFQLRLIVFCHEVLKESVIQLTIIQENKLINFIHHFVGNSIVFAGRLPIRNCFVSLEFRCGEGLYFT